MYNVQIREIINRWVDEGTQNDLTVAESIKAKIDHIYDLYGTEQAIDAITISMLLSVAYADAFKLYSYRQKEGTLLDSDVEFLSQLYDADNLIKLYSDASLSSDFLYRLLDASYQFHNMGMLGKIMVVKSLSMSEKSWLLSEFPNFQEDLDCFDVEVTMEKVIDTLVAMHQYQEKAMLMSFPESILMNALGFIRNLSKIDPHNGESLLYAVGRIDYMASKYLVEQVHVEDDILIDHIDIYENYSLDDAFNYLQYNQNFLHDALIMVAAVYVYHNYESTPIDEDSITATGKSGFTKKYFK